MTEICNDNRFELIEKYKNELLESTNIADSKEEMDVLDSILFRFWQMGWLDGLENVNRLLNDCNTYKIRWAKAGRTARTEAIKEFAEEYKDTIKSFAGMFTDDGFYVSLQSVLYAVDFITEKLTEEQK